MSNYFISEEVYSEKQDTTNRFLAEIANGMGNITPKEMKLLQTYVREGLVAKILDETDQIAVQQVESMTASSSSGSTVSIDYDVFVSKMGHVSIGWYEFVYDGAAWTFNGEVISLAEYGMSFAGEPANDEKIVVHEIGNELIFDVLASDGYDVPADKNRKHALSLGLHDCYCNIRWDMTELLFYVDPATYPDGLPIGTYNITSNHGAYNGSVTEDGTFKFTTTKVVPAGGGIRHTSMGSYRSTYDKSNVLSGKFITYDTSFKVIEELSTSEGVDGTSLGETSSGDPQYKTNALLNFTARNIYGSNNIDSTVRQWLNSAEATGWCKPTKPFGMPQTSPVAGFLHGIDPELLDVIGPVRKRTMLHAADGGGYVDTAETVFLQSMTEVGFGANNGVYETPVDHDGNAKTTCYPYWEGATNSDRIKYLAGAARPWWLRSANPHVALSAHARIVSSSGALDSNTVYATCAAVPSCCII